ncbi:MAG: flagellar hook-basal body complex protein FliE [Desulfobacterota bacterium]|nr:flagellar hook-basal body complex protein FliE [Thermodesulfobacteriota bacterium]MDW8002792.1 flagellar hook-basal body complex protein FliE [Deltaproteobacteria bacterium]
MKVENIKLPDFSHSLEKANEKDAVSFKEFLRESLEKVAEIEKEATKEVERLAKNEFEDLHSVMIALEKADLTFQLMMQIRNKIITAYEEIMRMQV